MARGELESAFAQAAAQDGIELSGQSFDWLCEQRHVGLEPVAKRGVIRRSPSRSRRRLGPLTAIYARLNGDPSVLPAARENYRR